MTPPTRQFRRRFHAGLRSTLTSGGFNSSARPALKPTRANPARATRSEVTPDYRVARILVERIVWSLAIWFHDSRSRAAKGIIRGRVRWWRCGRRSQQGDSLSRMFFDSSRFRLKTTTTAISWLAHGRDCGDPAEFFRRVNYALDHADYARHSQNRKPVEFDPALEVLGRQ